MVVLSSWFSVVVCCSVVVACWLCASIMWLHLHDDWTSMVVSATNVVVASVLVFLPQSRFSVVVALTSKVSYLVFDWDCC